MSDISSPNGRECHVGPLHRGCFVVCSVGAWKGPPKEHIGKNTFLLVLQVTKFDETTIWSHQFEIHCSSLTSAELCRSSWGKLSWITWRSKNDQIWIAHHTFLWLHWGNVPIIPCGDAEWICRMYVLNVFDTCALCPVIRMQHASQWCLCKHRNL